MVLLSETLLDYVAIIILIIVMIYSKTQFSRDVESNKRFEILVFSEFELSSRYIKLSVKKTNEGADILSVTMHHICA